MLNGAFTIGAQGMLDLPIIGSVPAAGLHANELAKLITDRLQVRSGSSERAVTTNQRKQPARGSDRTNVVERPFAAQPNTNGSRILPEPTARKKQQAHEQEQRSKTDALLRQLSAARMELEAVRKEALAALQGAHDDEVRNSQRLAAEGQRAASMARELSAARADLEAVKVQQTSAASRARQASAVLLNREHEFGRARTRQIHRAGSASRDGAPRNRCTKEQAANSR